MTMTSRIFCSVRLKFMSMTTNLAQYVLAEINKLHATKKILFYPTTHRSSAIFAPMLPLPPLPMNTTLLPPPVPPTTILPVTSVLSSLLRPSIELPSHRIMVFVNGDLDILPLTFNMCRADTFLSLLCRISTICAEDYGSLETGSPCYFFEHNGLQVSTKDTPITLGYGAVAPRYNVEAQYVCLTFRITVLHA